jgi:phage terminase large subunit-like protein
MVEHTLRMVDPSIPFSAVWASRGKVTRAEPISALCEQGRVHHVGAFPRLEDQMCAFIVDFNRSEMGYSPDRLDALVWALTELMSEGKSERRFLFANVQAAHFTQRAFVKTDSQTERLWNV